jgi:hypothetical protein
VYQKDLGRATGTIATAMRRFDPDKSWTKVDVPLIKDAMPLSATKARAALDALR